MRRYEKLDAPVDSAIDKDANYSAFGWLIGLTVIDGFRVGDGCGSGNGDDGAICAENHDGTSDLYGDEKRDGSGTGDWESKVNRNGSGKG